MSSYLLRTSSEGCGHIGTPSPFAPGSPVAGAEAIFQSAASETDLPIPDPEAADTCPERGQELRHAS
jgi:hypothetical protein